jgi:hypothetical protein
MSELSATPLTPSIISKNFMSSDVKSATPDIVIFNDEDLPIDVIADTIFENIGGHELINIARTDTVNGQPIYYNPIKNLSIMQQQYNPKNIISLQQTSDKYFANFSIKMDSTIPSIGSGTNNFNVYIDAKTGDIVVDTVNLRGDEQVEIQVSVDGTIYEAEL